MVQVELLRFSCTRKLFLRKCSVRWATFDVFWGGFVNFWTFISKRKLSKFSTSLRKIKVIKITKLFSLVLKIVQNPLNEWKPNQVTFF